MTSFAVIRPPGFNRLASLAADPGDSGPTIPPVSLYIHVPFCVSKCAYCDFYSEDGSVDAPAPPDRRAKPLWEPGATLGDAFVATVLAELEGGGLQALLTDVPTLYLGGGTPTALGFRLVELVRGVIRRVGLRADAEVTVETNPETTDPAVVEALLEHGVNRFSLGVQSFDDDVLRTLGRCHDTARALEAARLLEGLDAAFSIDLMCGVQGQTFASWDDTLERAVSCGARHASVYPLTVEPGAPMAAAVRSGRLAGPDPDAAADMMLVAEVALAAAGMPRYEVANYAQPGFESLHNLTYWTGGAYLGLGPGAASMLPMPLYTACGLHGLGEAAASQGDGRARFAVPADLERYLEHGGDVVDPDAEHLTEQEAAREDVMLGLRLTLGVSAEQVDSAGLTDVLAGLAERELVTLESDEDDVMRWRATQRGWLLGNEVFAAVWAGA